MTRKEAHKIFDECLDHGEEMKLHGQITFITHWQAGELQQITDEGWKRTWRKPSITP